MARTGLGLLYLGVCVASEICRFTPFVKLRNSWALFLQILLQYHTLLSSPFDSPKTRMLDLHSPTRLWWWFFSPVYSLSVVQNWVISIFLSSDSPIFSCLLHSAVEPIRGAFYFSHCIFSVLKFEFGSSLQLFFFPWGFPAFYLFQVCLQLLTEVFLWRLL